MGSEYESRRSTQNQTDKNKLSQSQMAEILDLKIQQKECMASARAKKKKKKKEKAKSTKLVRWIFKLIAPNGWLPPSVRKAKPSLTELCFLRSRASTAIGSVRNYGLQCLV